ncbi:MAG: ketopantoate reductase family protein [Candidatus Bathyarchaeota archaeon]|nr:ketopantoate reductase family protein [Candidatus Bathyarchaeota archaeon]
MSDPRGKGFNKVVVLGAGAIGSYYGALLSRKTDVLLIGDKSHVEKVNENGLVVSGSVEGRFPLKATAEPCEIPEGSLILLTTKAYDSEAAVTGLRGFLKPETVILILQNGLGNEEFVRGLVNPSTEVVRGLVSSGVEFLSPGRIEVKLVGETVLPKTHTGERIRQLFESCGLEARLTVDIEYEIWRKLTLNCVINPLTALFRVPNNEIVTDSLRGVRQRIVDECIRVAAEEGVELEPSLADAITNAAASYTNISSMCQDVIKGKRTEIDYLNGRVSELGRKHGVQTPVNDVFTALIRFMEGRKWT